MVGYLLFIGIWILLALIVGAIIYGGTKLDKLIKVALVLTVIIAITGLFLV